MRAAPLRRWLPLLLLAGCAAPSKGDAGGFFALHPDNPRYFAYEGRPTILVTSAEHYGAVLNLDFDHAAYLKTLQADGLNHTRTWLGTYREIPGSFGITDNTLAPDPKRFLCPWARAGEKFDLSRYDPAFFDRLKDFLSRAREAGVVVELNLFCPNYDDKLWRANPMHAANNVNGVGSCPADEAYTLKHQDLLDVQLALVRKVAAELRDVPNLYYEICNEPYFGGVTLEWQHRVVDELVAAERDFPRKHLISMNIANGRAVVENPHPAVSIFNFHYCVPPDVVALNAHLNRPIGENETGFRGKDDVLYRTEGWDFLLAGGAIYNNLDYSFTTKHATGTFLDYRSPGGGSPALRRQLRLLKDFLHGFDFPRMSPAPVEVSDGLRARALASAEQAAVYVHAPFYAENFSVRWSGLIEAPAAGAWTLIATADDGLRLQVGGATLIEDWAERATREAKAAVTFEAGRRLPFVLEYFQGTGGAQVKLAWEGPGQKRQTIPTVRLFQPDGTANGLQAEYFEGRELQTSRLVRTDAAVDFDWSGKSPFPREAKELVADLSIDRPAGRWRAAWIDTKTGAAVKAEEVDHPGGPLRLHSPPFRDDLALRLLR